MTWENMTKAQKLIWLKTISANNGLQERYASSSLFPLYFESANAKIRGLYQAGNVRRSGQPTPSEPKKLITNNGELVVRDGEIVAESAPEVITLSNKNLFDISEHALEQGDISSVTGDDDGTSSLRVRCTGYIPARMFREYTMSYSLQGVSTPAYQAFYYKTPSADGYLGRTSGWKNSGTTFSTPESVYYVRFVFATQANSTLPISPSDIDRVQFELGETATDYVPYASQKFHAETLLSGDEQNITKGIVTRKSSAIFYKGSDSWGTEQDATTGNTMFRTAAPNHIDEYGSFMCTHFVHSSQKGVLSSFYLDRSGYFPRIYFTPTDQTLTLAQWRTWLNGQMAQDNPVILVYPLSYGYEYTTRVEPQKGYTYEGNNALYVNKNTYKRIDYYVSVDRSSPIVGTGQVGYAVI